MLLKYMYLKLLLLLQCIYYWVTCRSKVTFVYDRVLCRNSVKSTLPTWMMKTLGMCEHLPHRDVFLCIQQFNNNFHIWTWAFKIQNFLSNFISHAICHDANSIRLQVWIEIWDFFLFFYFIFYVHLFLFLF